jgi:hypothetical protein
MKVSQNILNAQNPYVAVNVIRENENLDYTIQVENETIESERNSFEDLEDLIDDVKETLAYELQEKYPDNDELYSEKFIEKLDAIK